MGSSSDCKLMKKAISSGKCLKVNDTDTSLEIKFKTMINHLVLEDELIYYNFNGKKISYHSSYRKKSKVLIKINQLRLKNWFFKPIS